MNTRLRASVFALCMVALGTACSGTANPGDVAVEDAATPDDIAADAGPEPDAVASDGPLLDAPTPRDAPGDTAPAIDARPDARPDAGFADGATDARPDVPAPSDATTDATTDASPDVASPDASSDARVDASAMMDVPGDAPLDAGCAAGAVPCASSCVVLATDVNNCGACGMVCPAPSGGTASCATGRCVPVCPSGTHLVGSACVMNEPTPRPVAPLSLGDTTLRRPTLRWILPAGADGAVVELCRDRACATVIETLRVTGTSARPASPLPAHTVVFWRLRARTGAAEATTNGPTWLFHTPAVDASSGVDSSFNPHLDVNGDGFDDVAVGARQANPSGRMSAGSASVFLGGAAGVNMSAAQVMNGRAAGDRFGSSVASAGDVNGDGYGDLLVAARTATVGGRSSAGSVSVFHGGPTGVRSSADLVLDGGPMGFLFGESIGGAGDVNGDGYADVIVGSPYASPGGRSSAGTASVFHGGASGVAATPALVLEGARASDQFAAAVAGAGDVNGDGFSDVIVGAYAASLVPIRATGTASVFLGGTGGVSATAVLSHAAVDSTDQFGTAVASAGDVNGDGYADVVVGASSASPGGRTRVGSASVYLGSAAGGDASAIRVLEGAAMDDAFGCAVAAAGDVDGDGFGDVIVGAFYASPTATLHTGTASLFRGGAGGPAVAPALVLVGTGMNAGLGRAVAGAGDVNGDGFGDVVVGADGASPDGRAYVGAAYVHHGSSAGLGATATSVLAGSAMNSLFGGAVAALSPPHEPRLRTIAPRESVPFPRRTTPATARAWRPVAVRESDA